TERIFQKLDKHLEKLGYRRESRKFSPHLTVARVKSVQDRESLISIINSYANEGFGDIPVESIRLKKSVLTREGPIYSTIREVKLEG
ncbi:MAG TPA: RNA 2',3'-cyclic phosphodiesterase, partial [Thermoplasmatales archaeon]|nr:RNA 2',3'-cyclic phosphodiesterase [Thermoplasmatales archaeon]